MGQQESSSRHSSSPTSGEGTRRFPNNLLVMGSYLGTFATSHFKDWHRVDIQGRDDRFGLERLVAMKKMASFYLNVGGESDQRIQSIQNNMPDVSGLSEFDGLKNPIVEVVSAGTCQLFIDSENNMTMYKITNYEMHNFEMKKFRILEEQCKGLDKRNLIMIGSCQICFYFVFKDMTIVRFDHETNTILIIDFFKTHNMEIIAITRDCIGVTANILTKKEGEYELLKESAGLLVKLGLGELEQVKVENIRLLSAHAIVTNDNKLYLLNSLFSILNGFKYVKTPFENESQIVQVDGGYGHSVVLTEEGKVYGMGFNQYSQCGWPPGQSNIVNQFEQINLPEQYNSKVLQIGCGSLYTAILTETHILIVGQFSSGAVINLNRTRLVESSNGTRWIVTKNTFGINTLYCAGWHLCAIEMVKTKKNILFERLLRNTLWFSDIDIVFYEGN